MRSRKIDEVHSHTGVIPTGFNDGHVAYVRRVKSEDVSSIFPDAPQLMPGLQLFMLLDCDGSPLLLTDDEKTALANAKDYELETVSLH